MLGDFLTRTYDGSKTKQASPDSLEKYSTRSAEGDTWLDDADTCDGGDSPKPIYWAVFDVFLKLFQFHGINLNSIS